MYIKLKPIAVLWRILILVKAVEAFFSLLDLPSGIGNLGLLQYFYMLTALFIIIYYAVLDWWYIDDTKKENTCVVPILKGMLTVTALFTMVISHFVISKGHIPIFEEATPDLQLKYIIPIMIFIDWLLFDKKGGYKAFFPLVWCLPAILYTSYIYISVIALKTPVGSSGMYPYTFFDYQTNGVSQTIMILLAFAIINIAIGYIIFGLDKLSTKLSMSLKKG